MECIIIIDILNLLEQCVIVVIKRKENESIYMMMKTKRARKDVPFPSSKY